MIFKAYDIRGIYGRELTDEITYKIGRALVVFLKAKNLVVGYDMRKSTPNLYQELVRGITDQGCDVIDIGLSSTPITLFSNSFLKADGSVMITASHNPPEYNGLKLCSSFSVPISDESGILDIKKLVENNKFDNAKNKGQIIKKDVKNDYYGAMCRFLNTSKKLKIVIDFANSMGVLEAAPLAQFANIVSLYETLDGNMPNHEANPTRHEYYSNLSEKVREENADFGVMFDGDADRAGFVDENGEIISIDQIITLIAKDTLLKKGPQSIIYDLRSTKALKEIVEELGGTPIRIRVGNPFVKDKMRATDSTFGAELAGHFIYKDNFYSESSLLTVIKVMNIIIESKKKLSELIHEVQRYTRCEEINLEIEDKKRVLEKLEVFYYKGKADYLDGLTMEFEDGWWFNIRASNTEPILRVNIEANTKELLNKKKYELLETIEKITEHKI